MNKLSIPTENCFTENSISKKIIEHNGGLYNYVLKAGNYFLQYGIKDTIEIAFDIRSTPKFVDPRYKKPYVKLTFHNVKLHKPKIYEGNKAVDMLPSDAIQRRQTYAAQLSVSAKVQIISNGETLKTMEAHNLFIGGIPIMCGSILCNAKDIDPDRYGDLKLPRVIMKGLNIVEGLPYTTVSRKELTIGKFYTSIPTNKIDDKSPYYYNVKGEILSSDNPENIRSTRIELLAETNKGDIPSLRVEWKVEYFDNVYLPFYVMFYLLDILTDIEIVGYIINNFDNTHEKALFDILKRILTEENRLHGYTTKEEMWATLHDYLMEEQKPGPYLHRSKLIQDLTLDDVMENINAKFLPQMGTRTEDLEKKRIQYGLLVREMLEKYLALRGVYDEHKAHNIGETDRVDMGNAVVTMADNTLRRGLTTAFHKSFASHMRAQLENTTKGVNSMEELMKADFMSPFNTFKTSNTKNAETFSNMMRAIIPHTANRSSNKKDQPNYQMDDSGKGKMNSYEKLGSIIAFAPYKKSGSTVDNLRAPPASGFGASFGNMSTPESDPGKRQGIAITVEFTTPMLKDDVALLKKTIHDHPLVTILDQLTTFNRQNNVYYYIYINNSLFGATTNPMKLRNEIIEKRRNGQINRDISVFIEIHTRSVRFNTIGGRGKSYKFIVENNIRDHIKKRVPFTQWISYNEKTDKNKSISELIKEKKIESVFTDENIDRYVAISQKEFRNNINDPTNQYTHVEVMTNMLAITTCNIPFPGNTPGARGSFAGCHQLGASDSGDCLIEGKKKNMILHRLHFSYVSRIAEEITQPISTNAIVVFHTPMSAQDDGLMMRKAAADRSFMAGLYYDKKSEPLTQGYNLKIPEDHNTSGKRKDWNYNMLSPDGIIPVGSRVDEGVVLIGLCRANVDSETGFQFSDESKEHKGPGEAVVISTSYDNTSKEGTQIVVNLLKDMPASEGDKFATKTGNKAVNSIKAYDYDIVCSGKGLRPSMYVNSEACINRELTNTEYDLNLSKYAMAKGEFYDGTGFQKPLDFIETDEYRQTMRKLTGHDYGLELMYDSYTCDPVGMLEIGPLDMLRIQKNGITELYSVSDAKINNRTQQPDSGGRNTGGSHRVSEMDLQAFNGHGITIIPELFQTDKFEEARCIECNSEAIFNVRNKTYFCENCRSAKNVYCSDTTFAVYDMTSRMAAGNIDISPILKPPMEIKGTLDEDDEIHLFDDTLDDIDS